MRVRMVVRRGGVVVVAVDRQRERSAVRSVGVVGAMARQVTHRPDDPAEHERGELKGGGLLARGHARGILLPRPRGAQNAFASPIRSEWRGASWASFTCR